jgi:hypothetical protein
VVGVELERGREKAINPKHEILNEEGESGMRAKFLVWDLGFRIQDLGFRI